MRNHRCGRDSLLDPSFDRTSLYRTCMCVCVYTCTRSGERPRGELSRDSPTSSFYRSNNCFALPFENPLAKTKTRGIDVVQSCACTSEPVAVVLQRTRARSESAGRMKFLGEEMHARHRENCAANNGEYIAARKARLMIIRRRRAYSRPKFRKKEKKERVLNAIGK